MSEPETPAERSRDVDRLLTFVDAIVAIAITLLVLPLAELAAEVTSSDSVWHVVRAHDGQVGAFFLSFAVIARLWLAQHRVVRTAVEMTIPLSTTLILWTLTIVFLPFPTALLSAAGSQAATKALYLGALALSSVLLAAIAAAVRRQHGPAAARPELLPSLVMAVLFLLALTICIAVPAINYWALLLLTAEDVVVRALRRVAGRRGSGARRARTTRTG